MEAPVKVFKFKSTSKYQLIPRKSVQHQIEVDGVMQIQPRHINSIEFVDHKFETSDVPTAEYIRSLSIFGGDILEVIEGDAVPAGGKAPEEITVDTVDSKNKAVAFLTSKGATPEELKGKNVEALKAFALETYQVIFPNWK